MGATPYELAPVRAKPLLWLFGLGVVLPLAIVTFAATMHHESFSPRAGFAMALVVGVFVFLSSVMLRRHSARVHDGYLVVRSSLYSQRVPLQDIDGEKIDIVDLTDRREGRRPEWRLNGVGLPGYASGWFRLKNGARAFVVLTNSRAVYVPLRSGRALLIGFEAVEPAAQALRAASG